MAASAKPSNKKESTMPKHSIHNRDTFANGKEGRIRRDTRRAAIAAKRAWLEG
jgi:hypothetical protein